MAAAVATAPHSPPSVCSRIGAIDADRHRLAQLVGRLLGSEGQDRARAAVGLDDPDGLLDRAFLVRADREAQVAGIDRLLVGGQRDLPGRRRDALDADEDVHRQARTRAFSGSNSGVEPTTSTVTG